MADKVTVRTLAKHKAERRKIVCLTAYDAPSAVIASEAGVDVLLVGDSLGNVIQGASSTLFVSLEDIAYHTRCVAAHAGAAMVVADMPFGSYQSSASQAVDSAVALMKAGAEAVKLEGRYEEQIAAIAKAGIPVMGHAGMTPQSVHAFGGFRVQGRGKAAGGVEEDCRAIEEAGAFAVVLELVPNDLAGRITQGLRIPTIGIGAGPACDGQIQVWHDVLSLKTPVFRHAKVYADGKSLFTSALARYCEEVKSGEFPGPEHSF